MLVDQRKADVNISEEHGGWESTLPLVTPLEVAIESLLDDENNSGDMDYSKIGIPKEGFGFSNNIKPLITPPPFNKCVFEIKAGENTINIKVQYIS